MLGYMTLDQMVDQVGRMVGDTSSARRTKIKDWINTAYDTCCRRFRWPQIFRGSEDTLTLTANSRWLYIPNKYAERIFFLFPHDLDAPAPGINIEALFYIYTSAFDSTGPVQNYAEAGEVTTQVAFSTTAEKLDLVSSSVSDTAVVCYIRGLDSSGTDEISESVTLSGAVGVSSANTYSDLVQVTCDGTNVGVIAVTGNTSTTTYLTIAPGERTARYIRLRLAYVPTTADTYSYYYKKRVARLIDDNQVPEIPVSHAIVEYATASQFAQERKWGGAGQYHHALGEQRLL